MVHNPGRRNDTVYFFSIKLAQNKLQQSSGRDAVANLAGSLAGLRSLVMAAVPPADWCLIGSSSA